MSYVKFLVPTRFLIEKNVALFLYNVFNVDIKQRNPKLFSYNAHCIPMYLFLV